MNDLLTTHTLLHVFFFLFAVHIGLKLSTDIVREREVVKFRHLILAFLIYITASCLWTLREYEGIALPWSVFYGICFCSLFSVTINGYLFFSFTMLQLEPELSEKRWFRLVSQVPMGIIGACMLANFFNNMVFTITPDEHIIFNRWYPVLPVMIVLYLLVILGVSLLKSWQSRLLSQRKQYMTLAVSVLFIFLCVAIDDRLKDTTILPMAIFAAIFFVFINMQESNIYSDALTHMNNRRKADEYMASQLDRVSEADPLLLYMLDVNDFKHINDAFGHAEGDRALMLVATAVKMAAARYKGFAARYGGDEFILAVHPALLGKGFDPEAPIRDMQAHSEETCRAEGRRYTVTISAGWARCTRPRMLLTDCVKQADEMLYERKAEYHRRRDGA